jgi:hypothetical protein
MVFFPNHHSVNRNTTHSHRSQKSIHLIIEADSSTDQENTTICTSALELYLNIWFSIGLIHKFFILSMDKADMSGKSSGRSHLAPMTFHFIVDLCKQRFLDVAARGSAGRTMSAGKNCSN